MYGRRLPSQDEHGWFIDNSIRRIYVPSDMFRLGENSVELVGHFSRNLDLEAIYLTGRFGVDLQGIRKTITRLPDRLRVGDIVSQGLPFYSAGAVPDRIDGLPSPAEGERLKLTVDGFDGGCLELLNEGLHQICGWAPYELDLTQAARNGEPALLNVVTDPPQYVRAAASGSGAGRRIRAGELDDRGRLVHDGALHAASGRSDASSVAASRTAVVVRWARDRL